MPDKSWKVTSDIKHAVLSQKKAHSATLETIMQTIEGIQEQNKTIIAQHEETKRQLNVLNQQEHRRLALTLIFEMIKEVNRHLLHGCQCKDISKKNKHLLYPVISGKGQRAILVANGNGKQEEVLESDIQFTKHSNDTLTTLQGQVLYNDYIRASKRLSKLRHAVAHQVSEVYAYKDAFNELMTLGLPKDEVEFGKRLFVVVMNIHKGKTNLLFLDDNKHEKDKLFFKS